MRWTELASARRLEGDTRGRGSRGHDARAADGRGAAAARRNPLPSGQQRTRALLASSGAVGTPAREDRPAAGGSCVAGVPAGLPAVSPVAGRRAAGCAEVRRAVSALTGGL